jgi:hypothetical protein
MSEARPTVTKLRAEDAERMQRLSEEVRSRLEEMALIAARTLGRKLEPDAVRKFVPTNRAKESAALAGGPIVDVEITDNPDGTTTCTIFCPPPASEVFVENPCGSSPFQCP